MCIACAILASLAKFFPFPGPWGTVVYQTTSLCLEFMLNFGSVKCNVY